MNRSGVTLLLLACLIGGVGCGGKKKRISGWACRYDRTGCSCRESEPQNETEGCGDLRCCFKTRVPWEPHAASQYRAACWCYETDGGVCSNQHGGIAESTTHCP